MSGPVVSLRVTLGRVALTGAIDVTHERTMRLKVLHKLPPRTIPTKISENLLSRRPDINKSNWCVRKTPVTECATLIAVSRMCRGHSQASWDGDDMAGPSVR